MDIFLILSLELYNYILEYIYIHLELFIYMTWYKIIGSCHLLTGGSRSEDYGIIYR